MTAYDTQFRNFIGRGKPRFPASHQFDTRKTVLRYGENPHQRTLYVDGKSKSASGNGRQLNGKELSYNNFPSRRRFEIVRSFQNPPLPF